MSQFNTPILFLVFNRPETTKVVFEQIRNVRPEFLYIAADGPRSGNTNDLVNCAEVKRIVTEIDWPCQVTTLFRESNLGCKVAVSEGITWFFRHVEEGIILEDDILPDLSFFKYCETLLAHYREDVSIMHISGFNVCGTWKEKIQSYHASYFGSIWGWASWRRAWKNYDVNIKRWNDQELQEKILTTFFPKEMREQRRQLYNDLFDGKIDTWDYQWTLSRLINGGGKSIIPSKNLIVNLGFTSAATHTIEKPSWITNKKYILPMPLQLSFAIEVDQEYDTQHNLYAMGRTQNTSSSSAKFRSLIRLSLKGVINKLKRSINRL